MAYYVDQVKANVHITAENWKRFQQDCPSQFDKDGNLRYCGSKSSSAHWNSPYFENGDVRELWHRDENGWDETCEQWLALLLMWEMILKSFFTARMMSGGATALKTESSWI